MPGIVTEHQVCRVWVASGCIRCGWCGDLMPEVFQLSAQGGARILGDVRQDGRTSDNRRERSPLIRPRSGDQADFIQFVADGCPVKVILFD